ncbi:hypothetical protein FOS14_05865 [Skermania sp. ID1734]|uniref:hypothetical protein n=1 Tax=Skermania sp. ID1734 TaxID=2597516 RepID=UPI00117C0057|nr:hypothetical protein [Skermania sp. ID1734]TSE00574.1 hypothetical protein FOS14_05865 [Skermania sp. ID1734]
MKGDALDLDRPRRIVGDEYAPLREWGGGDFADHAHHLQDTGASVDAMLTALDIADALTAVGLTVGEVFALHEKDASLDATDLKIVGALSNMTPGSVCDFLESENLDSLERIDGEPVTERDRELVSLAGYPHWNAVDAVRQERAEVEHSESAPTAKEHNING